MASSEQLCYVDCDACDVVLAVSVPRARMTGIVPVRCGHCCNILSLNLEDENQRSLTSLMSHRPTFQMPPARLTEPPPAHRTPEPEESQMSVSSANPSSRIQELVGSMHSSINFEKM